MKRKRSAIACIVVLCLSFTPRSMAQASQSGDVRITIDVATPQHAVSPTLFGIFFEDINLSADGGLYPELVRNRSFEDADTLQNWKFSSMNPSGTASITTADVQSRPPVPPLNAFNRKSLCINAHGAFKLINEGYWGMNIVRGATYSCTFAARLSAKGAEGLQIKLVGSTGTILASGEIRGIDGDWKYHSVNLTSSGSDPKA
ncbi:MAG TPA: alpha-L-arabinofuranosidase, partial [Bacteroidota bacterium]|nr:alpha-L-arabinofuranosidase [Bacteroidota bacterium]